MAQWFATKADHPDAILFFRMGDFYELFFAEAQAAAAALDIALTSRGEHAGAPIPMCGVPVHTSEVYLGRLIRRGFRVAVVEQMTSVRPQMIADVAPQIRPGGTQGPSGRSRRHDIDGVRGQISLHALARRSLKIRQAENLNVMWQCVALDSQAKAANISGGDPRYGPTRDAGGTTISQLLSCCPKRRLQMKGQTYLPVIECKR
jgi:hypothetical protein